MKILFKALRLDGQGWVEGDVVHSAGGKIFIVEHETLTDEPEPGFNSEGIGCGVEDRGINDRYSAAEYGFNQGVERMMECWPCMDEVDPKTVCQYTGFTDKHGVEIFGGDIYEKEYVVSMIAGARCGGKIGKLNIPLGWNPTSDIDDDIEIDTDWIAKEIEITGNIHTTEASDGE